MADEIVEEVVEEVKEEVVEESVAEETKTKIEVKIEFTAEELAALVSSIADAPTGGYQNVTKNKAVYSLPTKKLAVKVAEKINLAVNEALGQVCNEFDAHAETMQGLRDDLTSEATTRGEADSLLQSQISQEASALQSTNSRIDNLISDVRVVGENVAKTAADSFLEEERGIRTEQIQAILDRVGVAAKSSTEPGIASLNESGQIPASQLPSYIDDVIEGYLESKTYFRGSDAYLVEPEWGKIYFDTNTGLCYRWSGSEFVVISSPVELGTGVGQAYPGNLGQSLADKVLQLDGSKLDKTAVPTATEAGPIKLYEVGLKLNANGQLYLDGISQAHIDKRNIQDSDSLYRSINPLMFDDILVAGLTSNKNTLSDDTKANGKVNDGQKAMVRKWLGLNDKSFLYYDDNWYYINNEPQPQILVNQDVRDKLSGTPKNGDFVFTKDKILARVQMIALAADSIQFNLVYICRFTNDTSWITQFYSATEPYVDINLRATNEVAKRFFRESFMIGQTHYGDNFIQDKNGNRFLLPSITQNETLALDSQVKSIEPEFGYYDLKGSSKHPVKRNGLYIVFSSNEQLKLYKSDGTVAVSGASQIIIMTTPYSANPTGNAFVAMGMQVGKATITKPIPVDGIQIEIDEGSYFTTDDDSVGYAVSQMVKGQ